MESNSKKLIRASLLLAIAIIFQFIGRNIPEINQFFVGPAVNAVLILAAYICGVWWGVGVGVLTPVLALLVGQLAAPMAPFIPFIMIGNALYVACFGFFKNLKGVQKGIGIIIGSLIKYAFLTLSASKLIVLFNLNFPPKVAQKLVAAMSMPQLVTALIGGAAGLVLIELLSKRKAI